MNEESKEKPVGQQTEQNEQQQADNSANSSPAEKTKEQELTEQIDRLQTEKNELIAKLQRLSADYINYQKRSTKLISDSVSYEKEVMIKSFLPFLDNFEHTIDGSVSSKDIESLQKGVKILYDQALSILRNYGVEQINSVGQKFDPALHEAVIQESQPDKEEGIILKEIAKGYKLSGKIIRPAKVVVNKKVAVSTPPSAQQIVDKGAESCEELKNNNDEELSDEDRE